MGLVRNGYYTSLQNKSYSFIRRPPLWVIVYNECICITCFMLIFKDISSISATATNSTMIMYIGKASFVILLLTLQLVQYPIYVAEIVSPSGTNRLIGTYNIRLVILMCATSTWFCDIFNRNKARLFFFLSLSVQ